MAEPTKIVDFALSATHLGAHPGGHGPGGDPLEARVSKLESDMTDIKVSLGRIEERLNGMSDSLATKADVSEIKGELRGKLGFWQFIIVIGGVVAILLRWPELFRAIGVTTS